jgi:hypothetical protein
VLAFYKLVVLANLDMVRVQDWLTEDQAIKALNVEQPSPSFYARFLQKYLKGTSPAVSNEADEALREWEAAAKQEIGKPHMGFVRNYLAKAPTCSSPSLPPGKGWRLPDTISKEERRFISEGLVSAQLRRLVDAWLQTGLDPNGSESPGKRTVPRETAEAMSEYLSENPATYVPSLDPNGFYLVLAVPSWSRPWAGNFFEAQRVESIRLLVGIMASHWLERLCKCRYSPCGKYFLQAQPRRSYRHGTFCCRDHQRRASAEVLTKARRSRAKISLVESAAKFLVKRGRSPAWQDDDGLKRRLAEFISTVVSQDPNLQLGRQDVKLHWVTRNRPLIEQRRLQLAAK